MIIGRQSNHPFAHLEMLAPQTTRPSGLAPPVTGKSKLADLAAQAAWRTHWPKVGANILGVFMFIFGLALAGLEIANLVVGNDVGSDVIPEILIKAISQSRRFRIGVGIWSGAVVAFAAIAIFIISEYRASFRNIESIDSYLVYCFRLCVQSATLGASCFFFHHCWPACLRNKYRNQCQPGRHRYYWWWFRFQESDFLSIGSSTIDCFILIIPALFGFSAHVLHCEISQSESRHQTANGHGIATMKAKQL